MSQSLRDTTQNESRCGASPTQLASCRTLKLSLQLATALLLSLITSGNRVFAQITPDATLGGESSTIERNVLINGLPSDEINGGAIRGTKLFHSFLDFNVTAGQGAYFTNPVGIENIFSRVTGGTPSNISGTLGVLGNANLLLLNPNGIIFGQTATLDLKGSFLATTASRINFADGTQFSILNPQASPLLTVSVPVGLGFGTTPGEILVQGSNLQVSPEKTLALVGGNVTLQGGNLIARAGRIELGSVADSDFVNLTPITKGWDLDYTGVQNFQDIQLSQGVSVDASGEGGGAIQVDGRNVTLSGGSRIVSYTLGSQLGEDIQVNASESVQLTGSGTYVQDVLPFAFGTFNPSELRNGFFTLDIGSGGAGNIEINTQQFTANNGAFVGSYTFGSGNAGNLTLNSIESVNLSATGIFTLAGMEATGKAGNLTINTSRLAMQDNAIAVTTTFGAGQGGELTVVASDSIDLVGAAPLQFMDINLELITALATNTFGDGDAGKASISTQRLTLLNGAVIQTGTGGKGQGGNLTVNASESVTLRGSELDGEFPSSFSAVTVSSSQGGSLEITTGKLVLEDGAGLLVSSLADGIAGDIRINAQNIQLRYQSQITATAEIASQGGNIEIDTDTLVALENSDITANAPQGSGGRITVSAQGIFGTEFREELTPESDITAFGKTPELSGIVELNTPDVNVQGDLNQLNTNFIDTEQAIASSCLARRNVEQGSFTVTGTGGLPQNPYEAISGQYQLSTVQGLQPLPQQQASSPIPNPQSLPPTAWKLGDPIQEAQGMTVTPDGRIIVGAMPQLVAAAPPQDLICNSSVQPTEN